MIIGSEGFFQKFSQIEMRIKVHPGGDHYTPYPDEGLKTFQQIREGIEIEQNFKRRLMNKKSGIHHKSFKSQSKGDRWKRYDVNNAMTYTYV